MNKEEGLDMHSSFMGAISNFSMPSVIRRGLAFTEVPLQGRIAAPGDVSKRMHRLLIGKQAYVHTEAQLSVAYTLLQDVHVGHGDVRMVDE